jgi:hypothetical protein
MRLPGYCTACHRFRQVRVSGAGMSRLVAMRSRVRQRVTPIVEFSAEEEDLWLGAMCGWEER